MIFLNHHGARIRFNMISPCFSSIVLLHDWTCRDFSSLVLPQKKKRQQRGGQYQTETAALLITLLAQKNEEVYQDAKIYWLGSTDYYLDAAVDVRRREKGGLHAPEYDLFCMPSAVPMQTVLCGLSHSPLAIKEWLVARHTN